MWDVTVVAFLQSNIILMWHECGLPVLAQAARPQLAGAMVGLPELCDETNAIIFVIDMTHV